MGGGASCCIYRGVGKEQPVLEEFLRAGVSATGPATSGLSLNFLDIGTSKKKINITELLDGKEPWRVPIGVNLLFLERFAADYDVENLRTHEVVDELIKPVTAEQQCSYVEWVVMNGPLQGRPFDITTHFVSHAWSYHFRDLLSTLKTFMRTQRLSRRDTYFYLDIFVINQHQPPWTNGFEPNDVLAPPITRSGKTVIVMAPWDNPTAFSRVWCLFELMTTIVSGSQLFICLPEQELKRFEEAVGKKFHLIMDAISNIDCKKAEASIPADKARIFLEIEAMGRREGCDGYQKLNETVLAPLKSWLLEAGKQAMARLEEAGDSNALAALLNNLGVALERQGNLEEAKPLHEKALALRTAVLGKQHPCVAQSLNNLAVLLYRMGCHMDAIRYFKKSLAVREKLLGPDDPQVAWTLNNLAAVLRGGAGVGPVHEASKLLASRKLLSEMELGAMRNQDSGWFFEAAVKDSGCTVSPESCTPPRHCRPICEAAAHLTYLTGTQSHT
ncbi:hypothetical protein CYMTET_7553 [Cymbomonas tetramitiformis]|uniref:Kinesin light chain n=1 Tax=Cymbomonas tetramitiformis TaxID=36881 RepID=A0AAE0LHC1_9CHLO|nr:hypothetical protein CYMTET_7553 [Cymbomonas tetramitiformis]